MNRIIDITFAKLSQYLEQYPVEQRFLGNDPFDGLNSPFIAKTFLGKSRFIRLAWVQLFKRNPLNFRQLALIGPGYNPQALGLFLSAYARLYQQFKKPADLQAMEFLINKIKDTAIAGFAGACWGYNFAWQARAFYQPQNTPMIVPTTAVFNGLLEAYRVLKRQDILDLALSAGDFVTNDLNRSYAGDSFAFSYSPADSSVIYNASLMASRVLAEVYRHTQNQNLLPEIEASVRFVVNHQHTDGHWTYGTKPFHQWIDNFHTGYNLESLAVVNKVVGIPGLDEAIERGFGYYIKTFFDEQGKSWYYADKTYPIDINNPAQLLSTLVTLDKVSAYEDLAERVIRYTANNMQARQGYFYYRQYPLFTNRINYLRWSQAWMFYGLTKYLYAG